MYDLPKITRARLKIINSDSTVTGDGSTDDPTLEEKNWLDIIASDAPELEVKKRKISVCGLADIVEYDSDSVKILYDGVTYIIKKPTNSLQIARARERSIMAAFEMLAAQFCVCVGAVPVKSDFQGVSVEVIQLLATVAERFFFTPFL